MYTKVWSDLTNRFVGYLWCASSVSWFFFFFIPCWSLHHYFTYDHQAENEISWFNFFFTQTRAHRFLYVAHVQQSQMPTLNLNLNFLLAESGSELLLLYYLFVVFCFTCESSSDVTLIRNIKIHWLQVHSLPTRIFAYFFVYAIATFISYSTNILKHHAF